MKEIDPGHCYILDVYDRKPWQNDFQSLTFMKRIGDPAEPTLRSRYPGNEPPGYCGTNCQEVIRALIARVAYLDGQHSCFENRVILFCLKIALWLFEFRAARVKGKFLPVNPLTAWRRSTCRECGHIQCDTHGGIMNPAIQYPRRTKKREVDRREK